MHGMLCNRKSWQRQLFSFPSFFFALSLFFSPCLCLLPSLSLATLPPSLSLLWKHPRRYNIPKSMQSVWLNVKSKIHNTVKTCFYKCEHLWDWAKVGHLTWCHSLRRVSPEIRLHTPPLLHTVAARHGWLEHFRFVCRVKPVHSLSSISQRTVQ